VAGRARRILSASRFGEHPGRQRRHLGDLGPAETGPATGASQVADDGVGGQDPDPTAPTTAAAEAAVGVDGDEGADGDAEAVRHDRGLPGHRRGVEATPADPDAPPSGPDRDPVGLGVDDPDTTAADHEMVDVGPAARQTAIVEDGPAPVAEPVEECGGRLLPRRTPPPPLGVGGRSPPRRHHEREAGSDRPPDTGVTT
jgi:hypothetical protein